MTQPCIITVAITGAVPRKKDNPAVPINTAEQVESTHAAFEAGASEIKGVPEHIIDSLIDGLSSTGDLNAIDREIERFKEYAALGLTEIAIRVHDDPVDGIKLIGEHIVPAVR